MIEITEVVRVGSLVRVRDADGEIEFRLVPREDADAMADLVSCESPLGRAVLGRRVGDEVQFRAPVGVLVATVVAIA